MGLLWQPPKTFTSLKSVEVNGLVDGDHGSIHQSIFHSRRPFTAAPTVGRNPESKTGQSCLVEKNLLKRYLQPFGLSITPKIEGGDNCCGPDTVLLPGINF
jgi:hypothetical protein